ncbi:LytTR family transcriptional regulator DNA-binding domain-containing protein [Rhizobium sp. FKY42]|uniref:LytTR family transcriptional regulator DNA-binding domain-containing protein n=1 Tax=Rhizobium sp. FKY42 TaxID=2562310 RepID=UPI0010C0EC7D|nr:LytTR family transcriptional regulator DNA-binding domain-containing protein [Rhizobium sp. FKY42]
MRSVYLQSTLRELQRFFGSPRFWATIVIVSIVFTVVGPFGTGASMPVLRRLAFWLFLQVTAFSIASFVIVLALAILGRSGRHRLTIMMIGAIIAALPIGLAVEVLQAGFTGQPISVRSAMEQITVSLLLSPLLCALTYLTMSPPASERQSDEQMDLRHESKPPAVSQPESSSASGAKHPADPAILSRLKPQNRGRLLRLAVQDHYTEVVTSRGKELILLRFSDALNETTPVAGQRIHRSHWVADDHIAHLKRENGRLSVVTKSGEELPVSRPNEAAIRLKFSDRQPS